MFCEKRKSVVSAGSKLFNTHYRGIDDTPTQEAYHGLNITPNANGFNHNLHKLESKLKRDSTVKMDSVYFESYSMETV